MLYLSDDKYLPLNPQMLSLNNVYNWSYDCTVWCTNVFLMYFIAGLDAFRTFLKSEFSEENVEFWLACEDFKKTESAEKIASKARMIYSEFIEADAPKEVSEIFHNSEYLSTYPLTHLLPIEGH